MFSHLVVLDTWLLNVDRCSFSIGKIRKNSHNLLLSEEGAPRGKFLLKAIDQGHCFRGTGWRARDLNKIEWVKDSNIFGRFPEFAHLVDCGHLCAALDRAVGLTRQEVAAILAQIPGAWALSAAEANGLEEFLLNRARYLRTALPELIWPQGTLDMATDDAS